MALRGSCGRNRSDGIQHLSELLGNLGLEVGLDLIDLGELGKGSILHNPDRHLKMTWPDTY